MPIQQERRVLRVQIRVPKSPMFRAAAKRKCDRVQSYSSLNPISATNVNAVFKAAAGQQLEAEFILRCVREQESADGAVRLDQLIECKLDWNGVLAMARSHAVLPLLHHKLTSMSWNRIPPAPRSEIELFFRQNAARNLGMAAELTEIIKLCRNNSIPVIPFKGVVLAQRLYGSFAQRVSSDLDVLVRQCDASKLRELLARRGYESSWALSACYDKELLRTMRQLPLAHKSLPWVVEVHTALLDGPDSQATSFESLNSRLEIMEVGGQSIGVLPIDEVLLYLCVHGAKHCWERLGWICDVAQLIRQHPDLDWATILARARQQKWERALLLGLTLARDLLGVTLPKAIERHRPVIHSLAEIVSAKLFAPRQVKEGTLWRLWFQLRCRECRRHRLWFAWSSVMRPTVADWQSLSLPAPASHFYYLFRPIRLVGKYISRLFGGSRPARVRPKDKT